MFPGFWFRFVSFGGRSASDGGRDEDIGKSGCLCGGCRKFPLCIEHLLVLNRCVWICW